MTILSGSTAAYGISIIKNNFIHEKNRGNYSQIKV